MSLHPDGCRVHSEVIQCITDHTHLVLTILTMVWAFLYFGLYIFYLMRSVYKLRSLPRQDHKLAHLMVSLQASPFLPLSN